jgi:hypothetical protein
VGKFCRAGQATNDNIAHAHCVLKSKGYKHTLRICNTFAFPRQQWLYESASVLRYTYGTMPVFLTLSLKLRILKLFYSTLSKVLAFIPHRIQNAFFKGMDGQKLYNETQFIINNHYLNRVLFYILILVT